MRSGQISGTPGARWRFRRDLVIFLAHGNGASERLLADVFDLTAARVHAIIDKIRRAYGDEFVGSTDLAPAHSARDRTGRGDPGDPFRTGRSPREPAAGAN